jgi:O-antigen/teichoic acid export membrane protein
MRTSVQFARKSVLSAMAGAFLILSNFLSSIVTARILGLSGTGEVAYIVWLLSISAIVMDLGFASVVARYVPEMRGRGECRQADQLAGYLVCILIAFMLALCVLTLVCLHLQPDFGFVSTTTFGSTSLLILMAIFVCAGVLGLFAQYYLRGLQDFGKLARICGAQLAIQVVCVLLGSLLFGVEGAVGGYVAGLIIPAVYALCLVRYAAPVETPLWLRVRRYAVYAWAANIANAFVWARIEVFFLQLYWDSKAVGLFTVALTLTNLAAQGPILLTTAVLSVLAEKRGKNDTESIRRIFSTGTRLVAALVFPACFGAAAVMPILIPFIFGSSFASAIPAASLLVCVSGLAVSTVIVTNLINALERNDFLFSNSLFGAACAVVMGFLLVPRLGLMGAAASRAMIQLLMIASGCWFVTRRLGFAFPLNTLARLLAASTASAATAALCVFVSRSPVCLLVAIPAAGAVYMLALRAFNALPVSDLALLIAVSESLPKPLDGIAQRIVGFIDSSSTLTNLDLLQQHPRKSHAESRKPPPAPGGS